MNEGSTISVNAPLWRSAGGNGGDWYFVSIGGAAGEALSAHALMDRLERGKGRGWGSVKVQVTVGDSQWSTSAFPLKNSGWAIPVKLAVRRAEGLVEGQPVAIALELA
ncbi:MAG: hypothetical protein RIS94_3125 [Pseudomonadota bacterium]|jgi:hypothetical protein